MSYICNICKTFLEGVRCVKVPTSFREKTYQQGNRTSFGYEIVKEISICPSCKEKYKIETPPKRVKLQLKNKKPKFNRRKRDTKERFTKQKGKF